MRRYNLREHKMFNNFFYLFEGFYYYQTLYEFERIKDGKRNKFLWLCDKYSVDLLFVNPLVKQNTNTKMCENLRYAFTQN
jgi:hypothetical protein